MDPTIENSTELEEAILIDDYSKYCFDVIKSVDENYLKKIGFTSEKDIRDLFLERVSVYKENKSEQECKFCHKKDIIQRSVQTRSIDEGETLITYCNNCKKSF